MAENQTTTADRTPLVLCPRCLRVPILCHCAATVTIKHGAATWTPLAVKQKPTRKVAKASR